MPTGPDPWSTWDVERWAGSGVDLHLDLGPGQGVRAGLEEALRRAVRDGRLAMDIEGEDGTGGETLLLGLAGLRRPVREYFAICDSYYRALRKATAREIETIDMARRAIHDHAAKLLLERLEGKIETDLATARRLFTLICVLHIKG